MAAASAHPPRPTLRDVALKAGVSAMTVSRALGNRYGIAPETRARIERIAGKLGYRPDPEIAKLMHHVRTRHRPRFHSLICGLTNRAPALDEPYTRAVAEGAQRRAAEIGHAFTVLPIPADPAEWPGLQRILRTRGAQGLLLLPQNEPIDLTKLIEWREFAVVAATTSVTAPAVHRVAPDVFGNSLLICRELTARGYRRIGFVTSTRHDLRLQHAADAAAIWHGQRESAHAVPPLILPEADPGLLQQWFRRTRPDVLVGSNPGELQWISRVLKLRVPGRIATVCLTTTGPLAKEVSGIDERPAAIGAAAVDMLAGMLVRRDQGLPKIPTSTVVSGAWREGRTCP